MKVMNSSAGFKKQLTALALASWLLAWPSAGLAQQEKAGLEEILVTAERKVSALQDTPISLAAFDSKKMEVEGINNLADIAAKVPNLTIQPFPTDSSTLRIYIRGVGLIDSQISQDPSIGVYIDGIYVARSVGTALDMADVERIEILRGPQGTLYGRNATGGAVNIVTRKPSVDAVEFNQKITVGNRAQLSSLSSINLPINDKMAVKLAYLFKQIDGFVDNGGPGGDWGDKDSQGWRLDYRWQIGDRLTLDYTHDASSIDYHNYTYQAVTPGTFRGSTIDLVQDNANEHVRNGPGYSDKRLRRLDSFAPLEESHNRISGDALTLAYEFQNGALLEYLFGYRDLTNSVYTDLASGAADETYRLDSNVYEAPDGRVFPFVPLDTEQDQFSHEFKFSGTILDERLEYTAGVYYFEEDATLAAVPIYHLFHSTLDNGDAPIAGPNTVILSAEAREQNVENEAWAAYARATYTPNWLDRRLHLTFGGRHSVDKRLAGKTSLKENYACQPLLRVCAPLSAEGFKASTTGRYEDDSFTAIAAFDVNDEINVYMKFDEAYRAGGFNVRDPHRDRNTAGNNYGFGFVEGFEPEKVEVVELGFRSQFRDNTMRFNVTVFSQQFVDQQINFLFGGNIADTKASNVGESDMDGGELDYTWQVSNALRLNFNYAYLDAKVVKATDPSTGNDVADQFVFSSAPKHAANIALDWHVMSADWGRLDWHASYNYMDERNGGAQAASVKYTFLESYGLWNTRLYASGIELAGGRLDVALWGKNLLDEEYVVDAINNLPQADRAVVWGESRTYGIDVSWHY